MQKLKPTVWFSNSVKNAAFFILLTLCTAPDGLYYAAPQLDAIVNKAQIFAGITIALLFLSYIIANGKAKQITIFFFIFWLDILLGTFITGGATDEVAIQALKILVLVCSLNMYKESLLEFLGIILLILEIQICMNLYYMISFPKGMLYLVSEKFKYTGTHWWLLGFDDRSNSIFFPAIGFELVYARCTGKRLRLLLLLAVIHAEAFLSVSSAMIVALLYIDVMLLFRLWRRERVFNYRNVMILLLIMNLAIISLSSNNDANAFICNLMGKDSATMNGRHVIWCRAQEMIVNSPLFGYGQMTDADLQTIVYMNTILHSHNLLLEVFFKGGLVLMALFCAIIADAGKVMMKFMKKDVAQLLLLALSAMLITAIFAPIIFGKWAMWASLLICMCSYADRLDRIAMRKG